MYNYLDCWSVYCPSNIVFFVTITNLIVSYILYTTILLQGKQLNCNPFNATLVVCSLGNPFNRGIGANILLRFDPKGLDDSESRLEFVVFANSTSHETELEEPLSLRATVVKRAELSLKG